MFEAAVSGARTDEVVVIRPALTAAAVDVPEADGYLLGTPAKLALGTLRRIRLHGWPVVQSALPVAAHQ
jgi:hypothetical protein